MRKRPLSPVAQAAKEIRQALKAQFPGHKFSVRSEGNAMGSSIRVTWTDGPTKAAVTAITDPYRKVDYCQYTQEILSGGNRYVTTKRYYSQERFVPIARQICQTHALWSDIDFDQLTIDVTDDGAKLSNSPTIIENSAWYSLDAMTREHLSEISFYTPPVQSSSSVPPESSSTITITENPAKDGIEIRFSDKPTDTTRQALKENGFRWSRSNGLWYAKRSAAALSFAQQLNQTLTTTPPSVLSLPAAPATPPAVQPSPPVDPSPQPEPETKASTYQVITQLPLLTPIEFLTDRQRLQHQLAHLNIEQLPTAQVEALLAVLA